MSYKSELLNWATTEADKFYSLINSKSAVDSFRSSISTASDEQAYGMAMGFFNLLNGIYNDYSSKQKQSHHQQKHVTVETMRFKDGSVKLFNPYTREVYAYYGNHEGLPHYSGLFDDKLAPNFIGRAGLAGSGGIFDQTADGDAFNYTSKKHYKFGSVERMYQQQAA